MGWSGASDVVVELKITIFGILDFSIFDLFRFFDLPIVQFSSKTHFLGHKFEDPSCRICSYGSYGPFWFSVKNRRDMEQRYQKKENWEKLHFQITVKINLFCGGKF